MLLTYYGFLVAGLILLAVFNRSSVLSQPRRTLIGYVLMPPVILLVSVLNLGFWANVVLTVLLILISNRWLRLHADAAIDQTAVHYALGLWLLDAVVPLLIYLMTQSRPSAERWSLLIAALLLLLIPIVLFSVYARDMQKKV